MIRSRARPSTAHRRAAACIAACIGAWALALPVLAGPDPPPSFQGLGAIPGVVAHSRATGLSSDGTTVVGACSAGAASCQAWRWTQLEGLQALGVLPGSASSAALDVSPDGSWIVGESDGEAFRWSAGTGLEALLPTLAGELLELSVDADGDTLVGTRFDYGSFTGSIFRWTPVTGAVVVRPTTATDVASFSDLSDDGVTATGYSGVPDDTDGFTWTESGGFAAIPALGEVYCQCGTAPQALSPDATVLVGDSGGQAFRFTPSAGSEGLGFLAEPVFAGSSSRALAVSADGSVVVGRDDSSGHPATAFVWTPTTGMIPLRDALESLGLGAALAGWQLTSAVGVSADGRTVAGNGIDPDGFEQAWIAFAPAWPGSAPLPVPTLSRAASVLLVFFLAVLAAALVHRRPAGPRGCDSIP